MASGLRCACCSNNTWINVGDADGASFAVLKSASSCRLSCSSKSGSRSIDWRSIKSRTVLVSVMVEKSKDGSYEFRLPVDRYDVVYSRYEVVVYVCYKIVTRSYTYISTMQAR